MRSIFESPSLSEKKIDQNLSNRRNSSSNHGRQNYVSWRKIGTPSLSKSNKCSARCHFFYVPKTELFFQSLLLLVQLCQVPNFQYFWNKWVTMILCFSSQSRIYHVCAQNILINHDSSQKTSNWAAAPQNHHQIEHGRMLIEKANFWLYLMMLSFTFLHENAIKYLRSYGSTYLIKP